MEIKKPATRNRFLDAQDANSKKKHLDTKKFEFAQASRLQSASKQIQILSVQEPRARPGIYSRVLEITTIKLNKKTKARLDKLKSYKRETYDDILQKILEILNLCKLSSEKAKSKLVQIDKENASLKQSKPLA